MTRRRFVRATLAVVALALLVPAATGAAGIEVAPVTRLPFPERGYIVSASDGTAISASTVRVRENGALVRDVRVSPTASSGLRFGVVLAVDSSESMAGPAYEAALEAARAFLGARRSGEEVGYVAFNGRITVVQSPTRDASAVERALDNPPDLAYGTRIYDALDRALALLRNARISAGSIVLLSDGADIGSRHDHDDVVTAARRQRVRIFTVGLRSNAFEGDALRSIATATGAAYAEAASPEDLQRIYEELGGRLASEHVVRYRSDARPETAVAVEITASGVGEARVHYVAPTPSGKAPYHQSLVSRFVLSPASVVAIGTAAAALIVWALALLVRGPTRDLVRRVESFASREPPDETDRPAPPRRAVPARDRTHGLWAKFERDVEVARIDRPARDIAAAVAASAGALFLLILLFSPTLALLGLLAPPIAARSYVRVKLSRVRNDFADQLPAALQVLASALRAGHSFSGALGVVIENVREPVRSELRRIAHDDQLGVPPESAIRRVAERMANRDLEQVALLAELQRTAGGNSAEVLDTVVDTIRQRSELRRLVRTLTAQGRMARWILTALPIGLAGFLWLLQPEIMSSFFGSPGGQVALLVAVLMVAAGSVAIQRIVDIDV